MGKTRILPIFDTNEISIKGMENQYIFNLHFRFDGESENVTSLLPPPIRIVLNEGTIYDCVSAVTKAYKTSKY